jgi:hypothetical protein
VPWNGTPDAKVAGKDQIRNDLHEFLNTGPEAFLCGEGIGSEKLLLFN